eukprot:1114302-Pelagomonas_calceolata.AAC.5
MLQWLAAIPDASVTGATSVTGVARFAEVFAYTAHTHKQARLRTFRPVCHALCRSQAPFSPLKWCSFSTHLVSCSAAQLHTHDLQAVPIAHLLTCEVTPGFPRSDHQPPTTPQAWALVKLGWPHLRRTIPYLTRVLLRFLATCDPQVVPSGLQIARLILKQEGLLGLYR